MSSPAWPPCINTQTTSEILMNNWPWINSLISVVAILIAAAVVRWQVRENSREKLRLEIYNDIHSVAHRMVGTEVNSSSFARNVILQLRCILESDLEFMLPAYQKNRAQDFVDLNVALGSSGIDVMMVLEKYEIASPELKIFRTALSCAREDLSEAFQPLFLEYVKILSAEWPDNQSTREAQIIHKSLPSPSDLERLEQLTDAYIDAAARYGNIHFDLSVETQNLLLGGLFRYRVPKRNPPDPSQYVISLEPKVVAKLEDYFENETLWGKRKKEIKQDTNHRFGAEN